MAKCVKKPFRRRKPDGGEVLVVTCCDCGKEVEVSNRGATRLRCDECKANEQRRLTREHRRRTRGRPRAEPAAVTHQYGPKRPEHGMTASDLVQWRHARAVELYRDELSVAVIAERLGLSEDTVREVLAKAGLQAHGDGRSALPFGLPV